jgi:hypothetical protein
MTATRPEIVDPGASERRQAPRREGTRFVLREARSGAAGRRAADLLAFEDAVRATTIEEWCDAEWPVTTAAREA